MSDIDPMTLFTAQGTAALPDAPAIVGGHCKDCNAVFFPYQSFGCENCGSVNIAQSRFDGRGRVLTTARVHFHADPKRPAPFTVAAILLDCGAFIRGVVAEESAEALQIDDTVVTTLVPFARADGGDMELRFQRKVAR